MAPEKQLSGFLAKFDPAMVTLIGHCRTAMRERFPTANELVCNNYNFFVIGYCATERPSDCVASLAANSKEIGLSFYRGETLPDPHKILQGCGSQNRFVRLSGAEHSAVRKWKSWLLPRPPRPTLHSLRWAAGS